MYQVCVCMCVDANSQCQMLTDTPLNEIQRSRHILRNIPPLQLLLAVNSWT